MIFQSLDILKIVALKMYQFDPIFDREAFKSLWKGEKNYMCVFISGIFKS